MNSDYFRIQRWFTYLSSFLHSLSLYSLSSPCFFSFSFVPHCAMMLCAIKLFLHISLLIDSIGRHKLRHPKPSAFSCLSLKVSIGSMQSKHQNKSVLNSMGTSLLQGLVIYLWITLDRGGVLIKCRSQFFFCIAV